jgi:hypothetical protein
MAFVAFVFLSLRVEGLGFKLTMVDLKLPKVTSIFIRGQRVNIQEVPPGLVLL